MSLGGSFAWSSKAQPPRPKRRPGQPLLLLLLFLRQGVDYCPGEGDRPLVRLLLIE